MQRCYVLHTRPWRETSLLVDVLTETQGRVRAIAKGARRPYSPFRGILQPFAVFSAQFSGKSELKSLIKAQWAGAEMLPAALSLHAWYLNELCLSATAPEDPNPALFAAYESAISALLGLKSLTVEKQKTALAELLRRFEIAFLVSLGLWADPLALVSDAAFSPKVDYFFDEGQGWGRLSSASFQLCVKGAVLQDITLAQYANPATQAEIRRVLRAFIARATAGRSISTRKILLELDKISVIPIK